MGLDKNRKQGADGIIADLTADPASAADTAQDVPAISGEVPQNSTATEGQPDNTSAPDDKNAYANQFKQRRPSLLKSLSSRRLLEEENEEIERTEVHPLMGGSAGTTVTAGSDEQQTVVTPSVKQSLTYQLTKQRQLSR
jgi:hypothetical protein